MEDISARYAADLDPVLNKVNVVFPAGHKVKQLFIFLNFCLAVSCNIGTT